MRKLKLRKGDVVVVITGKEKGKHGEVLKVFPSESRIIVSGVNMITKHQKASRTEEAGIVKKESKIHLSNVAFLDNDGQPTKVTFKVNDLGNKVRMARRSGQVIENKN